MSNNQKHMQTQEWHLKMIHASLNTTARIKKLYLLQGMPPGLLNISATMTYSECIDGKTATRPDNRTARVDEIGKFLSSNVCISIKTNSIINTNYLISLIDMCK